MSIHPTAIVDPRAQLGSGVEIGPYSIVGPEVVLGDGVRLMSHTVIGGITRLGEGCTVFPFASIGQQTQDLKFRGGRTSVEVGAGTTLREYVTVNAGTSEGDVTRVGRRCHIMAYCHIAHQCDVGDEVIMSNCSQLAGHVVVEEQATLGGMVGVHQFVRIGMMAFVGGMARVAQDVAPYFMVEGNPAAVHGPNVVGLRRRGVTEEVRETLKEAYRLLCRQGLATPEALQRMRRELQPCAELDRLIAFIEKSERGVTK